MEEIGDYQIVKQLGCGLLGTLYQAEHRFLKTKVALKILPENFTKETGFFQRFERGVQHLSALNHPHIIKMQTVSSCKGQYFLVTDFVADEKGDSKNIAQYILEKGPLSTEEAIDLLRKIASALDYAREHDVVHGFLKPSNIILGHKGTLGISDFGLAKILGEELLLTYTFKRISESIALQNSLFLENFCFLSPEQKKYQKASFSADVYAFGQICHFVLTGRASEGTIEVEHPGFKSLLQSTMQYAQEKRKTALLSLIDEILRDITPRHLVEENVREIPVQGDHSVAMMLKKEPVVTEYQPQQKLAKDMEPLSTKMVLIRGGLHFRGRDQGHRDESPRHQVSLKDFSLDIHPVTNEQFIRFLEFMGGEKDHNYHDLIRLKDSRINRAAGRLSIESGYALHPVVGVTWYGASAYATWIGKRLPTEAEWEVAAAGGNEEAIYPTGLEIEKRDANFFSSDTTPVKSYQPNGYGLYDMAGNVYEWCEDWYGYNYYEASMAEPNYPKGPLQGVYRVLRGGCWKSLKDDLRISHRHRNNPGTVNGTYGFRCASDV